MVRVSYVEMDHVTTMVTLYVVRSLTQDHEDITDIKIPPTTDELLSDTEPYLPVNLPGAKHHLPADSIDKM